MIHFGHQDPQNGALGDTLGTQDPQTGSLGSVREAKILKMDPKTFKMNPLGAFWEAKPLKMEPLGGTFRVQMETLRIIGGHVKNVMKKLSEI